MKFGLLLFLGLLVASCSDTVLDPNDIGNGDGNDDPASGNDLIFFNQEIFPIVQGSSHNLHSFSLKTGAITTVSQQGFISAPPVGNKLLYIDDTIPGSHRLYLANLDGSNKSFLLEDSLIESATLSPDGNSILYSVTYPLDPYDPFSIQYSRIKLVSLMVAAPISVVVLAEDADAAVMPTFSPDGKYIAYAKLEVSGFDKVIIYDIAARTPIDAGINLNSFSIDLEFDWSADSKQVLCLSTDVLLYDLASRNVTALNFPTEAGLPTFPVLSQDGKIAASGFTTGGVAMHSDIFLYDGRTWTNITNTPDSSEVLPHFSRDGKRIVFSAIYGGVDPFTTQVVPSSDLKVYENGATRTLTQGMIVRPLFGR